MISEKDKQLLTRKSRELAITLDTAVSLISETKKKKKIRTRESKIDFIGLNDDKR